MVKLEEIRIGSYVSVIVEKRDSRNIIESGYVKDIYTRLDRTFVVIDFTDYRICNDSVITFNIDKLNEVIMY